METSLTIQTVINQNRWPGWKEMQTLEAIQTRKSFNVTLLQASTIQLLQSRHQLQTRFLDPVSHPMDGTIQVDGYQMMKNVAGFESRVMKTVLSSQSCWVTTS
jgi:hypothetical protein